MAPGDAGLGIGITYIVFLLLPGYIAVRFSLRANNKLDDFERFDKLVYSALGGVVTLAVLLMLVENCWIFGALHSGLGLVASGPWCRKPMGVSDVSSMPLVYLVGGISAQSLLAVILGHVHGYFTLRRRQNIESADYAKQPWDVAEDWVEDGDKISVVTTDGAEIRGRLGEMGLRTKRRDVLLSAPRHVHRDRSGQEVHVGDPFANQLYLSQREISRIVLHESYGIDEYDYDTHRELVVTTLEAAWKAVSGFLAVILSATVLTLFGPVLFWLAAYRTISGRIG